MRDYWFQSTLPQGERLLRRLLRSTMSPSFNPRSRRGSDLVTPFKIRCAIICFNPRSRRGSDSILRHEVIPYLVSIHAPAGGATGIFKTLHLRRGSFNPRSRRGSDLLTVKDAVTFVAVSIHAPAGGATFTSKYQTQIVGEFQSTLPQGERPLIVDAPINKSCFNPRSRRGSD